MMRASPQPSFDAILTAIAVKSAMVRTDSVQTFCGLNVEKISHGIQEGRFQWVWDLNLGDNRRRELRFLALEVFRPEITKSFTLEDAIRVVLGETRQSFVSGDIVRRFRISRVSLSRLHRGGYLVGTISGGGFTTTRPALETFLRQRWIGGGQ